MRLRTDSCKAGHDADEQPLDGRKCNNPVDKPERIVYSGFASTEEGGQQPKRHKTIILLPRLEWERGDLGQLAACLPTNSFDCRKRNKIKILLRFKLKYDTIPSGR